MIIINVCYNHHFGRQPSKTAVTFIGLGHNPLAAPQLGRGFYNIKPATYDNCWI